MHSSQGTERGFNIKFVLQSFKKIHKFSKWRFRAPMFFLVIWLYMNDPMSFK